MFVSVFVIGALVRRHSHQVSAVRALLFSALCCGCTAFDLILGQTGSSKRSTEARRGPSATASATLVCLGWVLKGRPCVAAPQKRVRLARDSCTLRSGATSVTVGAAVGADASMLGEGGNCPRHLRAILIPTGPWTPLTSVVPMSAAAGEWTSGVFSCWDDYETFSTRHAHCVSDLVVSLAMLCA